MVEAFDVGFEFRDLWGDEVFDVSFEFRDLWRGEVFDVSFEVFDVSRTFKLGDLWVMCSSGEQRLYKICASEF
jgi:hypothetical protein